MIYEVRRYEAQPGMMPHLHEVMEKAAVPVFKKLGMKMIGAWIPLVGDYTNVLTYVLAFDSMNDRDEKWARFFKDEEWQQKRTEFAAKAGGPLVTREFHFFLTPTSYSPLQ